MKHLKIFEEFKLKKDKPYPRMYGSLSKLSPTMNKKRLKKEIEKDKKENK